jgi:hypothetical protein
LTQLPNLPRRLLGLLTKPLLVLLQLSVTQVLANF